MINVLIADDHSLIREGFKKILNRESDIAVIGEAGNAAEIMDSLSQNNCDVIVLDISLPGKSGLDIIDDIRTLYPDVKILILSIHSEEHYALRALKSGALGYLTKESAPDELIAAIRKVNDGRKYISEVVAEKLAEIISGGEHEAPLNELSNREFQVMLMLAGGNSIAKVSEKLSISASTVSTYRQRILEKLHLKNTSELMLFAIKNNLIDQ